MAIFSSREGAEEFVAGDPFVFNGVVRRSELREWTSCARSWRKALGLGRVVARVEASICPIDGLCSLVR